MKDAFDPDERINAGKLMPERQGRREPDQAGAPRAAMSEKSMQLVGVQLDIVWENRDANFDRVRALLSKSPPHPGASVALPEMFASGFSMNVDAIAEDESRATETFLADLSRQFDVYLIGGLVTRTPDGRGRNERLSPRRPERFSQGTASSIPIRRARRSSTTAPATNWRLFIGMSNGSRR